MLFTPTTVKIFDSVQMPALRRTVLHDIEFVISLLLHKVIRFYWNKNEIRGQLIDIVS